MSANRKECTTVLKNVSISNLVLTESKAEVKKQEALSKGFANKDDKLKLSVTIRFDEGSEAHNELLRIAKNACVERFGNTRIIDKKPPIISNKMQYERAKGKKLDEGVMTQEEYDEGLAKLTDPNGYFIQARKSKYEGMVGEMHIPVVDKYGDPVDVDSLPYKVIADVVVVAYTYSFAGGANNGVSFGLTAIKVIDASTQGVNYDYLSSVFEFEKKEPVIEEVLTVKAKEDKVIKGYFNYEESADKAPVRKGATPYEFEEDPNLPF